MAPYTLTPAVGAVCHCRAKAGLKRSPHSLQTRTRLSSLLRLNMDSSLKTNWLPSTAVQFPRKRHHSKRRRRWFGVKGSPRNWRRDSKCPLARRLRMCNHRSSTSFYINSVPSRDGYFEQDNAPCYTAAIVSRRVEEHAETSEG
ncbi:uncharacterized protein TNCV_4090241 [Trichonephila clavipes]|uniref:Uncharacterized protein n=1 Tax=Trichonephila clavipes TaxID=2585209 RepID=A0A8X6V6R1_TRICX|nr:uncharacterized protein TNCV_4090241 [Trichonephila clavipes]